MFQQNSPTKVWDSVKVSTVQSCMQCMGDTVGPPRAMRSAWPHWGGTSMGGLQERKAGDGEYLLFVMLDLHFLSGLN